MPYLIIAAAAAALLIILAALLMLLAAAIHAEARRARGILGPPPGPLARAARRITGLHVCHATPHHRQPGPARAALPARPERR